MKIKLLHRSRECIRTLDSMPVQAFWQTRRFRKILIVVTGLAAFITHYSQDRLQRMLHHAATTAQASDRSFEWGVELECANIAPLSRLG
jgi:hypothetical protein